MGLRPLSLRHFSHIKGRSWDGGTGPDHIQTKPQRARKWAELVSDQTCTTIGLCLDCPSVLTIKYLARGWRVKCFNLIFAYPIVLCLGQLVPQYSVERPFSYLFWVRPLHLEVTIGLRLFCIKHMWKTFFDLCF